MTTDFEELGSWSLSLLNGLLLWSGKPQTAPSLKELSQLLRKLPENQQDENLTFLSAQVIRSCQPKYIPILLSGLSCHYWRHSTTDELVVNRLLGLQHDAKKSVCGVVFKKGDLVWTCLSCGKDQTCVKCDTCFRHSNHEGHDVFFRRSQGDGGCCDW
jgi:hypothetical protein